MKRKLKRLWPLWLLLLALPLVAAAGFVLWAGLGPDAQPPALAALESDARVRVDTARWLVFEPVGQTPEVGLVFYPGGRVDPRAYAPPARALAEQGALVVIVPMPLGLAVLGIERAAEVQAAYPDVRLWAVGGHSLGGAMAARYALNNPDTVRGLALWASYPPGGDDLSGYNLEVVSIYGTLDGLAEPAAVLAAAPQLPPDTRWVAIEGGNHAQFGWYGPQDGDLPATISAEEQQAQVVAETAELLKSICSKDTCE